MTVGVVAHVWSREDGEPNALINECDVCILTNDGPKAERSFVECGELGDIVGEHRYSFEADSHVVSVAASTDILGELA